MHTSDQEVRLDTFVADYYTRIDPKNDECFASIVEQ